MADTLDFNPHYFHNPPFLTYIYALAMFVYSLVWKFFGLFIHLPEFMDQWRREPGSFYTIARAISAFFGVGACYIMYLIGRKLFNRDVGTISSIVLCFCFLHVRDSHYAVNDITSLFFTMIAFYYIADMWKEGRGGRYALAGIMSGIAIATKYNTGIILFSFIAFFFLQKPFLWHWRGIFTYFVFLCSAFFVFCPWIVLDGGAFWRGFAEQAMMTRNPWEEFTESSYIKIIKALLWGVGWVPVAMSVAGFAILIKEKRLLLLISSFPVIYYLFMGMSDLFFARFTMPIIPFISLLCGVLIWSISKRFGVEKRGFIILLLTVAAIFQSLIFTIAHNRLIGVKDSRIVAGEWMNQHVSTGSRIVIDRFSVDISKVDYINGKTGDFEYIVKDTGMNKKSLSLYIEDKFEYFVTSDYIRVFCKRNPNIYKRENDYYKDLERSATLIYSSKKCKKSQLFFIDDIYSPFRNIFNQERPGPCIKVYKLKTAISDQLSAVS